MEMPFLKENVMEQIVTVVRNLSAENPNVIDSVYIRIIKAKSCHSLMFISLITRHIF